MNIIDSFFVALGFDIDSSDLERFKEEAAGARNIALAAGAAIVAMGGAIAGMVIETAKSIDELGDWSEANNIAVEQIQALGHAAQIEGSSLGAMKQSVSGLNRAMGESIAGIGRGVIAFKTWGLNAKDASGNAKTFDVMLGEIADKMVGMSHQEGVSMAQKFGIDASLIPLLTKGKDRLKELTDEAMAFGVVSQAQATTAGDLTDALDRLMFVVLGVRRAIAAELMPPITKALIAMRQWIMANREFIKHSILAPLKFIAGVASILLDILIAIISPISSMVAWFISFRPVVYAAAAALIFFAGVLTYDAITGAALMFVNITRAVWAFVLSMNAANASVLLVPALIGAIVLAIALLIDDLMAWRDGNESVIGDLAEKFPWAIDLAIASIVALGAALVALTWNAVASFATILASLSQTAIIWVADMIWIATTTWGTLIPAMVAAAVSGVASFGSLAIAILAATWPILAIIAGVVALGAAAYLLWDNWGAVLGWLHTKFEGFLALVDRVVAAAKGIGKFFGFGGDVTVTGDTASQMAQAPALGGGPGNPKNAPMAANMARGGVIGRGANENTPVQHNDNSQHLQIDKIEVISPDPEKAGEAVERKLAERNRRIIRNGQTGVAY